MLMDNAVFSLLFRIWPYFLFCLYLSGVLKVIFCCCCRSVVFHFSSVDSKTEAAKQNGYFFSVLDWYCICLASLLCWLFAVNQIAPRGTLKISQSNLIFHVLWNCNLCTFLLCKCIRILAMNPQKVYICNMESGGHKHFALSCWSTHRPPRKRCHLKRIKSQHAPLHQWYPHTHAIHPNHVYCSKGATLLHFFANNKLDGLSSLRPRS